jgi:hypothetical protein
MAKTVSSIQFLAMVAAAANFNDRIDDNRQIGGSVQYATIQVPITADNEALDVINLIQLPPGAIVLPELSKIIVTNDATSGALTIDIGDVVNPDRYCDGANCAATGTVDFCAPAFPEGLLTRHKVDPGTVTDIVTMTLATFTATIEAGEVVVVLAYKTL